MISGALTPPAKRVNRIVGVDPVDDDGEVAKIASDLRVAVNVRSLDRAPPPRKVLVKRIEMKVTRKQKRESVTARFRLGWRQSLPSSTLISKTISDRKTLVVVVREVAVADSKRCRVVCRSRVFDPT